MKKYILAIFLFVAMFGASCGNSNNPVKNNTDTLSGNTDSTGSQPVQAPAGPAGSGNATDSVARRSDTVPRIDSVVRH